MRPWDGVAAVGRRFSLGAETGREDVAALDDVAAVRAGEPIRAASTDEALARFVDASRVVISGD